MARYDGFFNGMYGKRHRESSKLLMSIKKKDIYEGENNPFFGKSQTDEVKDQISKSRSNSVWIHNKSLNQTKSVPLTVVYLYTNNGWIRGRGKLKK